MMEYCIAVIMVAAWAALYLGLYVYGLVKT